MMEKIFSVYILRCADDSYYTGVTNDLPRRLAEHMSGNNEDSYTAARLPVELVWHEEFIYILSAIAREKQIKNWSREKKEALIEGRLYDLRWHSRKKKDKKSG
jgi:putative endonuclease